MKLTTCSVAKTKHNKGKLITDSKSTTKIDVRPDQALFLILLMSAVIYKQRFMHGNKTVQYL